MESNVEHSDSVSTNSQANGPYGVVGDLLGCSIGLAHGCLVGLKV